MSLIAKFVVLAVSTALLAGCTSTEDRTPRPPASQAALTPPAAPPVPAPPGFTGPVLDAGGTCNGPVPSAATAIAPGIGECELVRLKGKPPTDVLVGEGRTGREVQVLYNEPGAKELYFFVNNKLDRIVKS
ncbi:hypothetical protein [Methylobacterium gnaphalii]|uniref:Lipoprotein n=1 Tax=Methylobacterium gnaphalii TaxID=1010610 RepID=A0A512JN96_9HYPH|nr:hypothetical protein [Methylobacterium gnaphalii]GEP11414.1 hypothetical protein MGN01_32590 [Methylobacterium gnaphalii]GJD69828.1 hypothetical protein MMMDOFMJ_2766 [Methylobacterium gnaphalii]GLS48008.1 hypothetical protein GCM10007885_08520 [Methylobacterium gnaphalii]